MQHRVAKISVIKEQEEEEVGNVYIC